MQYLRGSFSVAMNLGDKGREWARIFGAKKKPTKKPKAKKAK